MKPLDQFVQRMMEAAQLVKHQDVGAATDVIHKALRDAGLMSAPTRAPAPEAAAQPAEETAAFVDLNPRPTWAEPDGTGGAPRSRTRGTSQPKPPRPEPDITSHKARTGRPGTRPSRPAMRSPLGPFPGTARQAPFHQEPGQFLSGSFANEAGRRSYRLYVPARTLPAPPALLVMLHGCKQDPDDFALGTGMNSLAEEHGFLVLYPEQTAKANGSNCWNWFDEGHQNEGKGEPSIIAGMTRQVIKEHGVDADRVYIAGLSAGGAMAAVLASAYPGLFAAAGVHSGLPVGCASDVPSAFAAMNRAAPAHGGRPAARVVAGVPIIVMHGDRDSVVHPCNGGEVLDQFIGLSESGRRQDTRRLTAGGRAVTVTRVEHEGTAIAEHWEIHGAGHAWSGGRAAGSYTDPIGPDASAEMLRFFLETSRRSGKQTSS